MGDLTFAVRREGILVGLAGFVSFRFVFFSLRHARQALFAVRGMF